MEINGDKHKKSEDIINPHQSPLISIKINGTLLIPINPHCPLIAQVLI